MSKALDKTIAVGVLMALVFAALAFGTVEAWSLAIFELIIAALLMLWTVKAIADRHIRVVLPAVAFPIMALIALGLVQAVALTGADGTTRSLSKDVEATRAAVIA